MDSVFSTQWTPTTQVAYFGTWMFIFFLAVVSRGLSALKTILEGYWFQKHASTTVVISTNDDGKVKVVSGGQNVRVWRTSVDIPRSFLQMVSSGVNYLLYALYLSRDTDFQNDYRYDDECGILFRGFGGYIFRRTWIWKVNCVWSCPYRHRYKCRDNHGSKTTELKGKISKDKYNIFTKCLIEGQEHSTENSRNHLG
jgi:Ctr copper transporter family